jgi:Asp-tRNA(Asn)/Glu-tRNA(Gln) amidotransferase C subunit
MASLCTSYRRLLPSIRGRSTSFRPAPSRFYTLGPEDKNADIESILEKPSWSVRSLLPEESRESQTPSLTPKELRHLLRLSALPQPSSEAEEKKMLETLESQIHFVKEIQCIDTTGVEPLRSIRDETSEARKENTIGLDNLKDIMAREKVIGRSRKIERLPAEKNTKPDGDAWDGNALGSASRTMGRYFVVETSR